ncbi:hypothetical protein SLS58_009184 [Diplodia intermedia]|uniref:Uncharacterized protein n=1 Tax=Diplodia intermedia TaxID=856260 RepID=A0ABR3TDN3_9PEZI
MEDDPSGTLRGSPEYIAFSSISTRFVTFMSAIRIRLPWTSRNPSKVLWESVLIFSTQECFDLPNPPDFIHDDTCRRPYACGGAHNNNCSGSANASDSDEGHDRSFHGGCGRDLLRRNVDLLNPPDSIHDVTCCAVVGLIEKRARLRTKITNLPNIFAHILEKSNGYQKGLPRWWR